MGECKRHDSADLIVGVEAGAFTRNESRIVQDGKYSFHRLFTLETIASSMRRIGGQERTGSALRSSPLTLGVASKATRRPQTLV